MESYKNGRWIIPFKKFSRIRVKRRVKSTEVHGKHEVNGGWREFITRLIMQDII